MRTNKSTIVRSWPQKASRLAFQTLQSTSTHAAAAALERAFMTPSRGKTPDAERDFLETGRAERVRGPNGDLAVWSWGEGRTVLLAHGWGSRASRFRTIVPALLNAGFRAVAFDAPGHGASAGRRSSLPETARAIRFLARRERERRGALPRAVIAHSFGCAAALLAQDSNVRFASNVFLAPAVDFDGIMQRTADMFGVSDGTVRRMIRRIERRLGFSWDSVRVTSYARGLGSRALIFHDPEDVEVPFRDAQSLYEAWSGAELVSTPDLGHRRLLHDTQVAQRIVRFLQKDRDTGPRVVR
ncbi:MAG: alpha/beta hydrolase [Longimicrobiales bacterium]